MFHGLMIARLVNDYAMAFLAVAAGIALIIFALAAYKAASEDEEEE